MYGVKPFSANGTQQTVNEKLDQIKNDTRKFDSVVTRCSDIENKVMQIETSLSTVHECVSVHGDKLNCVLNDDTVLKRLDAIELTVFGKDDDTSLYQEANQTSLLEQIKALSDKLEDMRNEYVELIGSYIENGTPRLDKNRLDDYDKRLSAVETYEKRIKVLEERPKFNVTGGLPKEAFTKENLTKDNLNKLPLDKVKR